MYMQTMVYPHNGIILDNEKEWTIDIWFNMDEPQNNYTK